MILCRRGQAQRRRKSSRTKSTALATQMDAIRVEHPIPVLSREIGSVITSRRPRSIQTENHSPITLSVLAVAGSKVGVYAVFCPRSNEMEHGMRWIKSAGGPLICVEKELSSFWQGVLGNSVSGHAASAALNDYDRACAVADYVGIVELPRRFALVLGDMPLETTVWCPSSEPPLIVRVFYMDPGVDLLRLLAAHGNLSFADPIESIDCEIESGHMVIFDSAVPGLHEGHASLSFEIPPGRYGILTKVFEPDSRTSVLIHKFVCKGSES